MRRLTRRPRIDGRRARAGALSLALLAPLAGVAFAAGPETARAKASPTTASSTATPAAPTADDPLFGELEKHQDETLAEHKAGEWGTLRILVIVLLCVFLFPIGIAVLITCLIVDPP